MSLAVVNGVDRHLALMMGRASKLAPAMGSIGNLLVEDAKLTFREQRDPWGRAWRPLSDTTRLLRAKRRAGGQIYKKRGGMTKRAERVFFTAQALLDTGRLRNSIAFTVAGSTVTVGTNVIYAGTQQFGANKRAFRGVAPWGDVPARAFLPVRRDGRVDLPIRTRRAIVAVMAKHLLLKR